MKRKYYHYSQCEEYVPDGGMWRQITGPRARDYIERAANLMAVSELFKRAMLRALDEWPVSTAMNLSMSQKNRRAWIGHAGCYLATGSPEECTRQGWHTLNDAQQFKANYVADEVIREWRRRQREHKQHRLFADA